MYSKVLFTHRKNTLNTNKCLEKELIPPPVPLALDESGSSTSDI